MKKVLIHLTKIFSWSTFTASSFFVWYVKLCSSAFANYLLFFSSPLHLSGSVRLDEGQTHIFRFLQKHLIGFKLRLWLGHSRTFIELSISHSCWVLWVIVLLESKPSTHLRFLMLWTGFSLRLYLYILVHWAFLLFWWVPQSLLLKNSPTAWGCDQHTLLLGCTLHVMSRAGSLQTWCLEFKFIRPDNIISHSLRVL